MDSTSPLLTEQFSSRFNSTAIMSSRYCATCDKGVRQLLVLIPLRTVETSVISENDGITVRQSVTSTIQLWLNELGTPCSSRILRRNLGTKIHYVPKPSCRNSGAGPYDITTMKHGDVYILHGEC